MPTTKILISLLLLCIVLTSCPNRSVESPGDIAFLEQDSVAIIKQKFRFAFRHPISSNLRKTLYATIVVRQYPAPTYMGGSCINIKLDKSENGLFKGEFLVPDSIASFWVRLSDAASYIDDVSSDEYVVHKSNGEFVQGVNLLHLSNASPTEYLDLIHSEQSSYPGNMEILVYKWMYELEHGIINYNNVKQELTQIKSQRTDAALADALILIGSAIIGDKKERSAAAVRLANHVSSPVFNTEYTPLILKALSPYKKEFSNLLLNNPRSVIAWLTLVRGDFMHLPKDAISRMLRMRITMDNEIMDHYYYGRLLLGSYPDSLYSAKRHLEYVLARSGSLEIIYDDPRHELQIQMPNVYLYLGETYVKLKEYEKAFKVLDAGISQVDNTDSRAGFMYMMKAEAYKGMGRYDGAQEQYLNALDVLPEYFASALNDSLKQIKAISSSGQGYRLIAYEEVSRRHRRPSQPLNEMLLKFRTDMNESINLNSVSETVVVEFWSTNCGFCDENVKKIADYYNHKTMTSEDVITYVIPNVEPSVFRRIIGMKLPARMHVAYDGNKIARQCQINSYPVTLVVKGGRQIARLDGSYGHEDFEEIIKKFVSSKKKDG